MEMALLKFVATKATVSCPRFPQAEVGESKAEATMRKEVQNWSFI